MSLGHGHRATPTSEMELGKAARVGAGDEAAASAAGQRRTFGFVLRLWEQKIEKFVFPRCEAAV